MVAAPAPRPRLAAETRCGAVSSRGPDILRRVPVADVAPALPMLRARHRSAVAGCSMLR
jgi:hypothetical protein